MGLLSDFAGAFATNVGNQMQQQEEIDYQLQIQEALERRRRQYQEEDYLRRRGDKNEDQATAINAAGPTIGYDDTGRQSLMGQRASVDPKTRALSVSRERLGDAPVTPTGRPFTVYDGQNKRTVQRFSDGSERDLGDPSPVRAASSGKSGAGARDRFEMRNIGGRVMRVNVSTGEKEDMGPASREGTKGSKSESVDDVRKLWNTTAKSINEAKGEELRSMAIQYGMDQRGMPTDDESLRTALLANMESEFSGRLKSASSRGDKPESNGEAEAIAAARAAIQRGAPEDAVLKRLREKFPGASL